MSIKHAVLHIILTIATAALAACQPPTMPPATSPNSSQIATAVLPAAPEPTYPKTTPEPTPGHGPAVAYGYTYQQPDGNRMVAGRGALPHALSGDLTLDGEPVWLVAAPVAAGSMWAVVLADGRVEGFYVAGNVVQEVTVEPERLPAGAPPLLHVRGVNPILIGPPAMASQWSHPVVLDEAGRLAYIGQGGDVVIGQGSELARLQVNALPDARLLMDEDRRLLLLTDPTDRYAHGVLGDQLEAASITLVETQPVPRVVLRIALPSPQVVEGLAPIWADLDGDGRREILVTVSDADQGAQVVVFDERGERVAAGPAIGRGNRWRHQLAVAPFGPQGELELVDVLTPHIGGVVGFYRWSGSQLEVVAQLPGFSSHAIGSRNLDMAAAGDFDGDGRLELLVPNQQRTELAGLRRSAEGAAVAWTVAVGGEISTNLAAAALQDGSMAVGVGRRGGVLRLWLP